MTDNTYWETLIGFSALIFAGYPAIKDVVNHETNAIFAFVATIIFAFVMVCSYLIIIKKFQK